MDRRSLGADYVWPGNYRELEQCIRNLLIRKRLPARAAAREGMRPAICSSPPRRAA